MLDSIEMKLEVGMGSMTKAVVAMCFSSLTADVKNWSSDVKRTLLSDFFHFDRLRSDGNDRDDESRSGSLQRTCSLVGTADRTDERTRTEVFNTVGVDLRDRTGR